jgi:hypothetical protein
MGRREGQLFSSEMRGCSPSDEFRPVTVAAERGSLEAVFQQIQTLPQQAA